MYRQGLVVLDGTARGERILPWVRRAGLAPGGIVRLLIVHDRARSVVVAGRTLAYVDQVEGSLRATSLAYLGAVAARLREDGLSVVTEVRFGDPRDAVLEAVGDSGADLLALVHAEPAGLAALWSKSVTDRIMERSPVPLLAVRATGQRAA